MLGVTVYKSFGQNFLTDTNILQKNCGHCWDLISRVNVIEIGPGWALTESLAENAAEVMAIWDWWPLGSHLGRLWFWYVTICRSQDIHVGSQQYIASLKSELPIKISSQPSYYITTPNIPPWFRSHCFQKFVVMMQGSPATIFMANGLAHEKRTKTRCA